MTGPMATALDPGELAEARFLVVPPDPGPLRSLARPARDRDELDDLVDDLFGQPSDERPGAFDIGLIVAGVAGVAWAIIGGGVGPLVLGAVLLALGLALPAQRVARSVGDRRRRADRRRTIGDGILLDVSDPDVTRLTSAYAALLPLRDEPRAPLAGPSVTAAHLALVEVATLLEGQPPSDDASRGYVRRRAEAIEGTTAQLRNGVAAALAADAAVSTPDDSAARIWAAARLRAREELEQVHRIGSVDQLASLRERLERMAGHERE
jgi:hypothetical protein